MSVRSGDDNLPMPVVRLTGRTYLLSEARDLWQYRDLLYFLVWRDVKVRYKQTLFGVAWALLQPLGMMAIFSLFLGRYARVSSDGVPYGLFVLSGLLLWQLFSSGVIEAGNSVVANERLITKVYFPRVLIPGAAVLAGIVEFFIGILVLAIFMAAKRQPISSAVVYAPVAVLMTVGVAFGVSLWLSALNVRYRDVRYAIGFLVQVWMFVSPVVYPMSVIPERWRLLYSLNPVAVAIEAFRLFIFGRSSLVPVHALVGVLSTIAIIISGALYFRKAEEEFADII